MLRGSTCGRLTQTGSPRDHSNDPISVVEIGLCAARSCPDALGPRWTKPVAPLHAFHPTAGLIERLRVTMGAT
jgi:hypothetical protein